MTGRAIAIAGLALFAACGTAIADVPDSSPGGEAVGSMPPAEDAAALPLTTPGTTDGSLPPDDAASDATNDGAIDAASDAVTADADGGSGDAPIDAPPDAPPSCTMGDTRCNAYKLEMCSAAHVWEWQMGDQSCCHDPRFTVAGVTVTDAMTGLHWHRYGGTTTTSSATICETTYGPGARLPTTAELVNIEIGPPVNNHSVCSPMIDQVAFQNVSDGKTLTSDGCVDLLFGTTSASCGGGVVGFLCVVP